MSLLDPRTLETFENSLDRCYAGSDFLDRFYERFLDSSPSVRAKFENTDFVRQKRALRASLQLLLLAAGDGETGPARHLRSLAERHSRAQLDIGAELYDNWLDSLLATARQFDPIWSNDVEKAWEQVLGLGIRYMLDHYQDPPRSR